jgi:hypothetical protein
MASATLLDPMGYGSTISYANTDPYMTVLYGVDCVADDLIVRLTTGSLWYLPGFGFDTGSAVNSTFAPKAICAAIHAQIKADERVAGVVVTASGATTGALTIVASVTLQGGEQFTLVGSPSSLPGSAFVFTVQGIN